MLVYDSGQRTVLPVPETNHYYDLLTYCLERIIDNKPGITDFEEAVLGVKLALGLIKHVS